MKPYYERKRWIIFKRNHINKWVYFSWLMDGFLIHIPMFTIICKYKNNRKMIVHIR